VLEPRMPALKSDLAEKGMPQTDEMAVLHAMFPQELKKVHSGEAASIANVAKKSEVSSSASRYKMTVDGSPYSVSVEELA
jgi:hypothetical protein